MKSQIATSPNNNFFAGQEGGRRKPPYALLFEKISHIELKQLEYQKNTDERFDKVFQYIEDHAESEQKVFFDGQIYDAFSFIVSLIQKAHTEIVLIDSYVDVKIITYANARLSNNDILNYK